MAITPTTIATLANLLIPGYDKQVEFNLREVPTFRAMVDRRPVQVDNPGDTVNFTWHGDLATTTTPLSETTSPDPLVVGNPTRTNVVVQEYGTWVQKTLRLSKTAFTAIDSEIAELLSRQQGDTIDALIRAVMDASTNTLDLTTGATKTFQSNTARIIRNKMRRNLIAPKAGQDYVQYVHPDVSFDVMAESGQNVWSSPHTYGGDVQAVYTGEIGRYSALRFVESTRCKVTNPSSGVAGTYLSYTFGRQALVEAVVVEPHTVMGEITDPLKRFVPVGWHAFLGWNTFRPQSLLVTKSQSSLAPALP